MKYRTPHMSTFAVENKESSPKASEAITDAEILAVIAECCEDEPVDRKKPSEGDLQERIGELEFELDCLRADAERVQKRIQALRTLLQVFDFERFAEKDQVYLRAIVTRVLYLLR